MKADEDTHVQTRVKTRKTVAFPPFHNCACMCVSVSVSVCVCVCERERERERVFSTPFVSGPANWPLALGAHALCHAL